MPTKRQLIEVTAPFFGFMSGSTPNIDPKVFTRCVNVLFDKNGCATKRPGFTDSDNTPAAIGAVPVDGIYLYIKQGTEGSPVTKTIYHAGGSIFAIPNGSYLSQATAIKSGMTVLKMVDHAVLSDKYFCGNGSQVLQVYDGDTMGDIATPPASGLTGNFTPSIIEVHRLALWAAGVPGNPSRLFKSDPLDGEDFNTNLAAFNVTDGYPLAGSVQIDVRPDDGTAITDMIGDHYGQLIVFKENSIHRLLGATKADFMLPPEGVIDGIGAIRGSVVRANNDVYFASKKGIHRLSTVEQYGDNQASYISASIQEYYKGLDQFGMLNRCQVIHWSEENIICWSFPLIGSGENNVLLVYHYAVNPPAGAWSVWSGVNVSAMALAEFDGANTLFVGDYDGQILRCNPWMRNDSGDAYTMEIELMFHATSFSSWVDWRDLIINCQTSGNGGVTVKAKVDNQAWGNSSTISVTPEGVPLDTFLLDTDYLADTSGMDQVRVPVDKTGRIFRLNFQNGELNESISILGIGIQFIPRKIYGIH